MKEKDWSNYQNNTLNDKVESLLLEFLVKYKDIDTVVEWQSCGEGF